MDLKSMGHSLILLLALVLASPAAFAQNDHNASPHSGWQAPPPPKTWTDQEHHGYMDGVEAAWLDLADHLPPKPSRHLMYRNPPGVKVNRRYRYREGFLKGYQIVYNHERHAHAAKGQPAAPAGKGS